MAHSENGFENPMNKFFQKNPNFVVDISEKIEVDGQNFSAEQDFTVSEAEENLETSARSLSRSSSMISVVVVEKEDLEGLYDSDDSEFGPNGISAMLIKSDTEINLSLDSKELAYLRLYLLSTVQWFPSKTWKRHKKVLKLAQFVVIVFFLVSLLNDFGVFGIRTLFQQRLHEPITVVKNILWKLRFLLMAVFGIYYGRKRHLERFLSELRLTRKYWKEARSMICKVSVWAFLGVFGFPLTLLVVRMMLPDKQEKEHFTPKEIVTNVALSAIVRYLSLPIFFVVVHVVFLIYCQIRLFKAQLQQWPQSDKEKIRDKFIDIRMMIKDTERVFQNFLVVHICLLLVTFIPEVFSAAERLHNESHYEQKFKTTKAQNLDFAFLKYRVNELILNENSSQVVYVPLKLPNLRIKNHLRRKIESTAAPTKTKIGDDVYTEHVVTETDYIGISKVIAAALTDISEICILYSLPLILLGKIDKLLKSLPDTIRTLKFGEQMKGGCAFQTDQDVEVALKQFTTAKSIQVLGMQINSLLAVLVTLSMPMFVTVLHIMLRYVDINP